MIKNHNNTEKQEEISYPKGLMILVIVLGVFLFIGSMLIIATIVYRISQPESNSFAKQSSIIYEEKLIDMGNNARLYDYKLQDKILVIHVKKEHANINNNPLDNKNLITDEIIIYDIRKKRIIDRIKFKQ